MKSKHLQKLMVLLLCIAIFSAGVAVAQQPAKSVAIPEALKKITKAFGTEFMYDGDLLRGKKTSYDLDNIRNKSLEEVLKGVLYPGGFLFVYLKENYYTIVPKDRVGEAYAKSNTPTNSPNIYNTNTTANQAQQSRNISGTVVNKSGNPLDGISITAKNAGTGTTTNAEGYFKILVNQNDVLIISSVGYIEQEIKIDKQENINITLEDQQKTLDEVVVVGYGTQKRSDITGSVASAPKERLSNLPVTNVLHALEGSVAGLNISQGSAQPGSSASIYIRGLNSITAGTSPLLIVDGMPFSGSYNDINPNDIKSIDILKDASAVAIYGTRGSAGVVLITTKRGRAGKPLINVNSYYGNEYMTQKLEFRGAEQYLQKYKDFAKQNNITNPAILPNAYEVDSYNKGIVTDWLDLVSQQGTIRNNEVNISGGTDAVKYYISGNYLKQNGVIKGQQYNRASIRSNVDINVTNWLTTGASLSYVANNRDGGKANFFLATVMSPYGRVYNATNPLLYEVYPMFAEQLFINPLASLDQPSLSRSKIFNGNFYTEITPGVVKGLRYRLNGVYGFNPSESQGYNGRTFGNLVGTASLSNSHTTNWVIENILTYARSFGKHNIDVTALYSAQKNRTFSNGISANTFINDQLAFYNVSAAQVQQATSSESQSQLLSQMLRVNYIFNDKYLLTATARRDGYSGFGVSSKYGIFPALAVGWNLSKEAFMSNIKAINLLKLRASYGISGNQAVPPYQTFTTLRTTPYIYSGATAIGVTPSRLGNSGLKWESTAGFNIGVDFALLENRITGTIDAYKTKTTDLLLSRQLPNITGYTSILDNVGSLANKGIEVSLNTVNIRTKDFTWQTGVNFSANDNKITDLYGDKKDDIGNRLFIGKPRGAIYDYRQIGVYQVGDDFSADPSAKPGFLKFADLDGDKTITSADREYLGTTLPKYIGGLTNTFRYKNFNLNIFIQTFQGSMRNNQQLNFSDYFGRLNSPVKVGYWTEENKNNERPSLVYLNPRSYEFPKNNSYTRIKDITLSYNFSKPVLDKFGLNNMMLYLSGRNIHTFSNWMGWDPETDWNQNWNSNDNYPNVATYVVGINLGLK